MMKKVIITLLCIFFMCTIVVCTDFERECETVPVIIKDVIVEPATVLKGFYLPEKYYLALEYNDKYIWTIPGKQTLRYAVDFAYYCTNWKVRLYRVHEREKHLNLNPYSR